MRIIAAIQADLDRSDVGTASRLAAELGGIPVLRRTVERVSAIEPVAQVYVLCPTEQAGRCERLLSGGRALVRPVEMPDSAWRDLVKSARKWSLDGWRGGLGGATYFDEFADIPLLARALADDPAEAVLCVPAAAPLLSIELAQRMIDHRLTAADQTRLVFTQAVPGLAGILLDRSLITEMADKSVPLGSLFGYKPDAPRKDLIFQPCCLEVPAELRFASGRLVADTDRAMVRIRQLLHDRPESDLISTGQWLMESDERAEPFPREVEIELTTDDPHPDTILRPRGQRVGQRGPLDLECVRKIAVELSSRDDSLVVLGGFGDPLRHPSFEEVVRLLRPGANCRGVYGLAIRSASLDLSESCIDCLIRSGADVLNVLLDAWTPSTYSLVHEAGASQGPGLEAVLGWLQQISDRRRAAGSVVPIVVPEFCKAKENVVEMDVFFDEWTRRLGTVSLVGYSHHAGQLPPRAVADMRPPTRTACRRLRTRCMILADGSVVQCDQDYRGVSPIGRMADQSLEEIWNSAKLRQLRADHQAGDWNANALCDRCEEWHRP